MLQNATIIKAMQNKDPHNPIPLGYASPSLFSQYLRSILPDCQPVFGGPRAPLTLHCEFKLGRNICDHDCSLHTFIFSTYFSYTRLRTYYLFYWFILCTRGYIESKKKTYKRFASNEELRPKSVCKPGICCNASSTILSNGNDNWGYMLLWTSPRADPNESSGNNFCDLVNFFANRWKLNNIKILKTRRTYWQNIRYKHTTFTRKSRIVSPLRSSLIPNYQ